MNRKNKYVKSAHINERKFRQILKLFCADISALKIAELTNLNRNTVNRYLRRFRVRIAEICEDSSPISGEIEMDESYFGAHRIRGKRGRGAQGKTIVFGLLKRGGKVYTQIVPDVSRKTLMQVINGKVKKTATMYTDGFKSYDGLVDWGYKQHHRVNHGQNEFVDLENHSNHINGIESFWGYAKNRLVKFQGIMKSEFYLHLKECEFRFNMRGKDMYKFLLKEFRKHPLN